MLLKSTSRESLEQRLELLGFDSGRPARSSGADSALLDAPRN